jgi:hypothetical protein
MLLKNDLREPDETFLYSAYLFSMSAWLYKPIGFCDAIFIVEQRCVSVGQFGLPAHCDGILAQVLF